ncbi:hypothetical protein DL98DRAFT_560013 [Cadophora sp. DSE1049]|nr:hypothetical protein DL98DRAFT_560013 [Cadophora sp. DSE1049]
MDAFISRKKRKLSPNSHLATHTNTLDHEYEKPRADQERCSTLTTPDDEETESTDFKLALLSSLHPDTDQQLLLDVLLAHDGSVDDASAALTTDSSSPRNNSSSNSASASTLGTRAAATAATTGYQSSLSNFISHSPSKSQSNLKDENLSLKGTKAKLLTKHGKTLHLYAPTDVETHTPCSIIHNFLPADEANALLKELLGEAESFERSSFKLFDNVVQSPHTACFYVESLEEVESQKTEYIYNGGKLDDVRQLTPLMKLIAPKVTTAINTSIATRQKSHSTTTTALEPDQQPPSTPEPWKPNAAFVNCYNGPTESVGYHSDQLTYLGPRAVIGSISLGVAREFRVRRIDRESEPRASDIQGQISIHLPHNSLLIMHAPMQEFWKHSIAPSQSIIPHPISGNKRINITYRDYKEYLHPKYTPRCRCGVPAVLRVVQRKRENWGRYFWMCYAGNVPVEGKDGCTYFEWAVFDERGRPIWKHGKGPIGKPSLSLIHATCR